MSIEGERLHKSEDSKNNEGFSLAVEAESSEACSTPRHSSDVEGSLTTCRVCHCVESDRRGDAALCFLDIDPPLQEVPSIKENQNLNNGEVAKGVECQINNGKDLGKVSGVTEFISPGGEIFICSTDLEAGFNQHHNKLICLGCSCKNDLSLVHYACALKWFVNHGSIVCEICGNVATNVRPSDFKKVVVSLKDYETLMEKTASGEPTSVLIESNSGVDPDAVAGIRRQRLCEIASWFNPNTTNNNNTNGVNINSSRISQGVADQSSNVLTEDAPPTESRLTKWAVEGTGILVATGLLTVTLAWLIAPRVGKKTAKNGLHFLLGGICALTVVVFLRFIVLSRIKYGPARYWAILFVFWFLVFGIWASRTHGSHSN